ncbi:MAG TPA: glycosyltransferase family 39 protein [Patescibacteria group bacterium]|nr:glycosyltransferase family 39 protein [Patescibacteria group bacterium]
MKKIAFIFAFIFFIAGLFTLKDYGINWDVINHLPRGQAYLNYYLTGKKDYSNLQDFFSGWQTLGQWYYQNPTSLFINADIPLSKVPTRSLYQNSDLNFSYFMSNDGYGHPPLSDILSSLFNVVLFQKLRIIDDIDAYHVYGVLLASVLVGLIFYWVSRVYGKIAGSLASLSLASYPLFWSEMHFNTEKDVPETVYWSIFIFFVWKGIVTKKAKWIFVSGIFFGLALGTKFNILFAVFVIVPWTLSYFIFEKQKLLSKINFKILFAAIFAFAIGILIFVVFWPYLWPDPIGRVQNVIQFYKDIGIATGPVDPRFSGPLGINYYPVFWIITTTPPIVLIFSGAGVIFGIINFKKHKEISILFLLWFLVPILRVTWHGANIYGGIRQLMEYVPALCAFAGIGGSYLFNKLRRFRNNLFVKSVFVAVVFLVLLVPIIGTHPVEDVYFNFLVGGLAGAKAMDIPAWGNSFGSAYRQAIDWIDVNVPKNSKLVYAYELIPNVPRIWIRQDIDLDNANRSGYLRNGEYAMTLNYEGTDTRSYYDMYLTTFLNPVYQEKIDGVPVVTVWKNDDAHLKNPWIEKKVPKVNVIKTENSLKFDLNDEYKISRLDMTYNQNKCSNLTSGYFEISNDNVSWTRLPGVLPDDWAISVLKQQPDKGKFTEPFVGQNVRFIKFNMLPENTCLLKNYRSFSFYYLQ